MDTDFGMVCEHQGAKCRISLSGRLTIDSSPDLRTLLLERLQSSSCESPTVDFYEVEYVDTSGSTWDGASTADDRPGGRCNARSSVSGE